jgi:hypothetical protein
MHTAHISNGNLSQKNGVVIILLLTVYANIEDSKNYLHQIGVYCDFYKYQALFTLLMLLTQNHLKAYR